jgi:HEAT repeat protein
MVQAALDRLAATGDPSVIPALLDLMDERRDAAPRGKLMEVVRAIAQRCGDAARAALVEYLDDTSPRQMAAILTLAKQGEVWALESLAQVFHSSAIPAARREAQRAVETILDYPVFWRTEDRRAGEAKHGESLRTYLASGSSVVRAAATKHMARVVSALQDLKDILANMSEDPIVRVAAVEGLQLMDHPGVYEPLHRALEDFDPAVREAVLHALQNAHNFEVRQKGRAAIVASIVANASPDVIMTTVGNEDHPRRSRAMFVKELRKVPGRIDPEKLTKTLSGVLDRSYDWAEEDLADLFLIHQSILALGELGTVSAIQSLLDYADRGECPDQVGVWEALTRILERDRDRGFQEIVGLLREGRLCPSTAKLLAAVGDLRAVPLLEPFARRVGDMSPQLDEFVKAAREAVARLEPLKTADRLALMLQTLDPSDSEDAEARWWAAAALAEQGDARGRVVLESARRDPATDAATRARVAELLARLGDGRSA